MCHDASREIRQIQLVSSKKSQKQGWSINVLAAWPRRHTFDQWHGQSAWPSSGFRLLGCWKAGHTHPCFPISNRRKQTSVAPIYSAARITPCMLRTLVGGNHSLMLISDQKRLPGASCSNIPMRGRDVMPRSCWPAASGIFSIRASRALCIRVARNGCAHGISLPPIRERSGVGAGHGSIAADHRQLGRRVAFACDGNPGGGLFYGTKVGGR